MNVFWLPFLRREPFHGQIVRPGMSTPGSRQWPGRLHGLVNSQHVEKKLPTTYFASHLISHSHYPTLYTWHGPLLTRCRRCTTDGGTVQPDQDHGGNVRAVCSSLVELALAGNGVGLVKVFVQSQAGIDRPLSPISSPRQSLYPSVTTAEGCKAIYWRTGACSSKFLPRDQYCTSFLSVFCRVTPQRIPALRPWCSHGQSQRVSARHCFRQYDVVSHDPRNFHFGHSPIWNLGPRTRVLVISAMVRM